MIPIKYERKIERVPFSGCWLWTGQMWRGYGFISLPDGNRRAHRVFYELLRGEIPRDKVLDHLCRVRCCVNPDHLEVVTNKENILRGEGLSAQNLKKTHCIHGHLLPTQPNKFVRGKISRRCMTCAREFDRKRVPQKRQQRRAKKAKEEEK